MYVIKMNSDKSLMTTIRSTIYRGEHNADTLKFLIPVNYEGANIADCDVSVEYVTPKGEIKTEPLELEPETYKNYYQYHLKVDSWFTSCPGSIKLSLEFRSKSMDFSMVTGSIYVKVYSQYDEKIPQDVAYECEAKINELSDMVNDINLREDTGKNSILQNYENGIETPTSWHGVNDQMDEWAKEEKSNGDDNNKIRVDENGRIIAGAFGDNSASFNGKGQSAGGKSFTGGSKCVALGNNATAFGNGTFAAGQHAFAAGCQNSAMANSSCAPFGALNTTWGYGSFAGGLGNKVKGYCGFGVGLKNHIGTDASYGVALGGCLDVQGLYQTVIGVCNNPSSRHLFIIGNGTISDDYNRGTPSNALTVDKAGNTWLAGNIETDYVILRSSTGSGKKFKLTVDDNGNIKTEKIT